jgi:hypothetical protein
MMVLALRRGDDDERALAEPDRVVREPGEGLAGAGEVADRELRARLGELRATAADRGGASDPQASSAGRPAAVPWACSTVRASARANTSVTTSNAARLARRQSSCRASPASHARA